jgi:steroid delta-isomerase-like uncharacterized protein
MANQEARNRLVDEHVACENRHDLDAILRTFGASARYDDQPWNEQHEGHSGVRAYYESILMAMPDLHIEIVRRFASEEAIVLEVVITGTHLGVWRGLPATRRPVTFPLCAVFTFDDADRLSGERIYYDRASILRQLGVFREPDTPGGRLELTLAHPVTLLRAFGRSLRH